MLIILALRTTAAETLRRSTGLGLDETIYAPKYQRVYHKLVVHNIEEQSAKNEYDKKI